MGNSGEDIRSPTPADQGALPHYGDQNLSLNESQGDEGAEFEGSTSTFYYGINTDMTIITHAPLHTGFCHHSVSSSQECSQKRELEDEDHSSDEVYFCSLLTFMPI